MPQPPEEIVRSGHLCTETFDWRGLHDVERLAGRDGPRLIHEPNRRRNVGAREEVRNRAAEFTGAHDGDMKHWWAIVVGMAKLSALSVGAQADSSRIRNQRTEAES